MKKRPLILLSILLVSVVWLGSPVLQTSSDVWAGARAENPEQDMDGEPEDYGKPGAIERDGPDQSESQPPKKPESTKHSATDALKRFLVIYLQMLLWKR
jgi:hypothetical protein